MEEREKETVKILLQYINKPTTVDNLISSLLKHKSQGETEEVILGGGTGVAGLSDWRVNLRAEFPTGLGKLDELLEGGIRRCELGLFAGVPESGKTRTLVNLAVNNLERYRVAYATLEQPYDQIRRFFAMAEYDLYEQEVTWKHLYRFKKLEDSKILQPLDFSIHHCNIGTLHDYLYRLGRFDILYIDYLDLLYPRSKETHKRFEYGEVTHELSLIAKEFRIAIWTATQADAESIRYGVRDIRSLAEAKIEKSKHVSIGIGIENTNNPMIQRYNVIKKRRKRTPSNRIEIQLGKYKIWG